ncbi:hypothetical protein [Streptomyces sp. NPDC088812]|uniref:hypothetical protein n=1 Tax=Streptomyces sp. NPDC088812 TaxID=3365905 RepID=UPI0038271B86
MSASSPAKTPRRTLSDLYAERDLTPAQARRLVALLGLAAQRPHNDDSAAGATATPSIENPYQCAS